MYRIFFAICCLFFCVLRVSSQNIPKKYIGKDILFNEIMKVEKRENHFTDTIPNDTVYIAYRNNDNFPYIFYREVFTPVCMDGACYPAWVILYWSPGGGHLGYSIKGMGDKNVLTKYEHEVFTDGDYLYLHRLLSDADLPLKNYKMEELVTDSNHVKSKDEMDVVSGATKSEVLDYTVAGAVYSTYTLWQITYGATRDSILALTNSFRSPSFLKRMLQSEEKLDLLWALEKVEDAEMQSDSIRQAVFHLLTKNDEDVKRLAMQRIGKSFPKSSEVVHDILQVYKVSDFDGKFFLLENMDLFSFTSANVDELITITLQDRATILQKVFQLLKGKSTPNLNIQYKIALLLESNNPMLSKIAVDYLLSIKDLDRTVAGKVDQYRKIGL